MTTKIVDAFQAFVAWLVDLVRDTILAPLTSMIEDVWNGVVDWAAGLGATLSRLAAEVGSGNISVASASLILVKMIVESVAFQAITLIGVAIYAVLLVLQPIVAPYVFILGTVVPLVLMAILKTTAQVMGEAIDAASSAIGSALEDIILPTLGSELANILSSVLSVVFGSATALTGFISVAVGGSMRAFALSVIGALISFVALTQVTSQTTSIGWVVVAVIGTVVSGLSIIADTLHESVEEALCPHWNTCSRLISWTSLGISVYGLGRTVYVYEQES